MPILEISGLNKYFGPTHANVDVDFTLNRGEIRGLIGENGSGKSTLISQIAGLYARDSGSIRVNGEDYNPQSPLDANSRKISMVVQELGVVETLSAGANIFLGNTKRFSRFGIVNNKAMHREAVSVFEKWDIPLVEPHIRTAGLQIETRKMIELARALSVDPDIILLDEITQSLSYNNREQLYALLKRLKDMGRSVVVITHDVEELIAITDTITVLRDGAVAGNLVSSAATPDEVKQLMVGRAASGEYYRTDNSPSFEPEVVLKADGISVAVSQESAVENVSFELHKGEILGFCGLSDSGIHTIGKAVYGLCKLSGGSVTLGGKRVLDPTDALTRKMAYVPKDRDSEALMMNADILENFALPSIGVVEGKVGYISPSKLRGIASAMVEKLSVKCRSIYQHMSDLSGGNKQKVNLGRWLAKDISVLVLDCPTRGVDVGVKAYIYDLMKQAKRDGIATLLISDELTELLGMSDTLVVMKDGKAADIVPRGKRFTEQDIIKVMI
jgi:ribose transport system ATP-binding protein